MSAELHIHVKTVTVSEEALATFFATDGSSRKYVAIGEFTPFRISPERAYDIIAETPHVWVGKECFLEALIKAIGDELPVIDDELIEKITSATAEDGRTLYELGRATDVLTFLNEHKGERIFTVCW
jgi:hypothetical protein